MEDIADLNVDGFRACGTNQKEEALVRRGTEAQRRRDQSEGRSGSLLFGEIGEDIHDDAMGGVEPTVNVGVTGGAENDIGVVGPRHRKARHVRRAEVLHELVKPVGVVAVVEVLEHDLPVPGHALRG